MQRARVAVIAVLIAMPIGLLGAWAFNPDSGAVLHSEILWRIFGIMFEGGLFLILALLVLLALGGAVRKLLSIGRPHGA